MKDNAQETITNYDGNARPGELVVNLVTDPPALYIGNSAGQLTTIFTGIVNSLPRFANISARDLAIPSPAPGMMIYVDGTGMQVRGATQWNTVPGTNT